MSVKVMSAVWEADLIMTAGEKLVLLKLADCANDQGGNAYPALATIAAACCLDERSVRRILSRFRENGVIEVQAEHDRAAHRPTTYRLVLTRLAGGQIVPPSNEADVPRPGDIDDTLRGTPVPPDPSLIHQITVRDRLVQIAEELVGARLSSRDLDDVDGWLTAGVSLEQVDEAYADMCEARPDVPWPFFRKVLGARLSKDALAARASVRKEGPTMTAEVLAAIAAEESEGEAK